MVLKNFEHFLLIYNRPPGSATASISRIGIILSIIKTNLSIEGVHLVVNPSPYPSILWQCLILQGLFSFLRRLQEGEIHDISGK